MLSKALLFGFVSLGALSAMSATPAYANDAWGGDIEVMDDAEMSDLRGGLNIGGVNIDIGAIVTTTLNGLPVLTTQLTVTDAGAIVEQTMSDVGQSISDMNSEQLEALGLEGLEGAEGIVIEDEAGVTALVHNVTDGALQNIIVNSATGRDITQDIDVTLTLTHFEFMQGSLELERFGFRIGDDLQSVMIGLGGS